MFRIPHSAFRTRYVPESEIRSRAVRLTALGAASGRSICLASSGGTLRLAQTHGTPPGFHPYKEELVTAPKLWSTLDRASEEVAHL